MWDYGFPFEVFLDVLVPLLSLTDICVLTQVNVGWKELCSEDDVWRILYMRTCPGKILDTSVHIGPKGGKGRRVRNRQLESRSRWKKTRVLKPVYYSYEPFTYSTTRYCVDSYSVLYNSWGCNCIPQDLKKSLKKWKDIRKDNPHLNPDDDSFAFKQGYVSHEKDTEEYCRYIRDEWRNYNRSKGISTTPLCQNPDHYEEKTLGISEECKSHKSYKKATLSVYRGKIKKENKKRERELKKAEKDFEKAYHIMVEMKKRMVEKSNWVEKGEKTLESIQCNRV